VGRCAAARKQACDGKRTPLLSSLGEVAALCIFRRADDTRWVKTGPCGATQQKASYCARVAALGDEVKALLQACRRRDLGSFEYEQGPLFDAHGATRTVSVGRGVAERQQAYAERDGDLEGALREANVFFHSRRGTSFEGCEDEGDVLDDVVGATWDVTVGRGTAEQQQEPQARVGFLKDSLAEVQVLYRTKYGCTLGEIEDFRNPV
jgi:hypothetical protein